MRIAAVDKISGAQKIHVRIGVSRRFQVLSSNRFLEEIECDEVLLVTISWGEIC